VDPAPRRLWSVPAWPPRRPPWRSPDSAADKVPPRWSRAARDPATPRNLSSNWAVVPGSVVAPWRPASGPGTASRHRPNSEPAAPVARYRSSRAWSAEVCDCSAASRVSRAPYRAGDRSSHASNRQWTRARHRYRRPRPASDSVSICSTRTTGRRPGRIPSSVSSARPERTSRSTRRWKTRKSRTRHYRCSSPERRCR